MYSSGCAFANLHKVERGHLGVDTLSLVIYINVIYRDNSLDIFEMCSLRIVRIFSCSNVQFEFRICNGDEMLEKNVGFEN